VIKGREGQMVYKIIGYVDEWVDHCSESVSPDPLGQLEVL